ncbi:MAG: putative DNA binding domain-containing protein [Lachnospiraceae bacterium]|nr:putative DNA binding domain-containing protein [Lachnospiraceae bacterium]
MEATKYDKKLLLEEKKPKSWCKSVSAFANTLGGSLIFGISNEGEIVGLENPDGDAEKIIEIIKTRLNPIPEFRLRFHNEAGKILVILDVFKGDETPYYYSEDGVLEAYVRMGNESVKATAIELKRLVLRGKNTSYDSQNSTYIVDDYAFSKLRERYKKWTGSSFDDKDLISFGLANEQGFLTYAGALIADESPIRCSRLFCTRWNGLNKSGGIIDALDDVEYEGSVISLIDNGEAFIKRNTKMMWRKTANSREEMPDGSIIQDRDPLTVPSTRRNPVLADEFNRLGYMERKGSGSGKILSGYEFQINYNDKKRPSFRSDRYQFTVIMPNLNYDVPHDELDIRIIDFIRKDSKISTDKMAALLGISSKTVKRHIKKMNNVHYVGRGFSGHWEIIE